MSFVYEEDAPRLSPTRLSRTFWSDNPIALDDLKSMMMKGRTSREIAEHLSVVYDAKITKDMVTRKIQSGARDSLAPGCDTYRPRSPWLIPGTVVMLKTLTRDGLSSVQVAERISRNFQVSLTKNSVISKLRQLKSIDPSSPILVRQKSVHANKEEKTVQRRIYSSGHKSFMLLSKMFSPVRRRRAEVRARAEEIAAESRPKDRKNLRNVRQSPIKPVVIPVPDESRSLTIMDLGHRMCRWILTDVIDVESTRYCAASTDEGVAWCPYHRSVATVPTRASTNPRPARFWR